jgi:hypothetical protein
MTRFMAFMELFIPYMCAYASMYLLNRLNTQTQNFYVTKVSKSTTIHGLWP